MAKTAVTSRKAPAPKSGGKPLVIVESPAKAKTIGKILGGEYMIEASVGHIRDLPASAAEIPADKKKEPWARLGIDVEHDFQPLYVISPGKREQIRKLKALLKDASLLYLATDEDREGESISWHLEEVLDPVRGPRPGSTRSRRSYPEALEHPRAIDMNLVEAQETRRIVDRLYGYSVSPLLWKKIRPRLSAGRVQSVAVRLIVERERERIRFRSADYWDLTGGFEAAGLPNGCSRPRCSRWRADAWPSARTSTRRRAG
jgi:DNA topoisomerase-1